MILKKNGKPICKPHILEEQETRAIPKCHALNMSQDHLPNILEIDIDSSWVIWGRLTRMKKSKNVDMEHDIGRLCNWNIVRVHSRHAFLAQIRLVDKLTVDHSSPCPSGPPSMSPIRRGRLEYLYADPCPSPCTRCKIVDQVNVYKGGHGFVSHGDFEHELGSEFPRCCVHRKRVGHLLKIGQAMNINSPVPIRLLIASRNQVDIYIP